ncbi:MAG: GIY-YIG nuclease family protein, partial [Oscillospiraceae bacterium]
DYMRLKENYIYILLCDDSTLYTGWTNDLEHRLKVHNEGKGAKYTKPRLPVTLVYSEGFSTKSEALKRECAIKKMTREDKMKLIASQKITK